MEDLIQNVRGSKKPKNAKMQLLIPFNPYPHPLQRPKNFKNVVYMTSKVVRTSGYRKRRLYAVSIKSQCFFANGKDT